MARVNIIGLMGDHIMVNIKMIKNMVLEYINGQMEKNTKGNGVMVNNMEEES